MTDIVLPIVVLLDMAYKASLEEYNSRLAATYSTGSMEIQVYRLLAVLVFHTAVFLRMDQI